MIHSILKKRSTRVKTLSLSAMMVLLLPLTVFAETAGRQIESGPYSITLRGGAANNSEALGADTRVDYLTPLLNVHLFGTFDLLNGGRGEGAIDNNRFGGGLALSHTYARLMNVFLGISYINEMGKDFGQAYLGGKLKVSNYALLSASYGFGFDKQKEIQKFTNTFIAAEAVDWLKVGATLVDRYGWKANASYYLTDPGREKISGIEGELSYPILDNLTVGVNGSLDLTNKADLEKNWRSFFFVTYAFGKQKGSPIDVALDMNSPVSYPKIIRKVVSKNVTSGSPITLSQDRTSSNGCSSQPVNFTASGGVAPYTWSTSDTHNSMVTTGSSTARWVDGSDSYCSSTSTLTVTVTDSVGGVATASIQLTGGA